MKKACGDTWMKATGESEDYFDLDQLSPGMLRRFRKSALTDAHGRFRAAPFGDFRVVAAQARAVEGSLGAFGAELFAL